MDMLQILTHSYEKFVLILMETLGNPVHVHKSVFTPIVCLLWSEAVDGFVKLEHLPLGLVSFHTDKNPNEQQCMTTSHVRTLMSLSGQTCKYRRKVLCFSLLRISVRVTLLCNASWHIPGKTMIAECRMHFEENIILLHTLQRRHAALRRLHRTRGLILSM